jgi:hypothetical protein
MHQGGGSSATFQAGFVQGANPGQASRAAFKEGTDRATGTGDRFVNTVRLVTYE